MNLSRYPEYKDSGALWLGSVPSHWCVLPNRAIFAEVKDRNHPDEEMLSVTITRGVIQQKAFLADSSKKDSSNLNKSAYKLVCQGDIAYNKMRAWQGAIGASNFRGIISPAYVVMRLRHDHNPSYFHELYRTPHFAKEAERWSYGITSDMWSLRPEHFKMIYSAIPPRDEQNAIVRFVDYASRRIERYIRAKKKLIALLNEQKQAIIHRAVTRGLDPNVRLTPSGVEWLGDLPDHWGAVPLKRLARRGPKMFTDGDWIETPFIRADGIRLVQTGNVGVGEYREKGFRYISEDTFRALRCTEIMPNDVLICRLDGPVGRACLVPQLPTKMITSVDNTILKLRDNTDPRFIVYFLSSPTWLEYIQSTCRAGGGFRYRISRSMLGEMNVPVPPMPEQAAIANFLDDATANVGAAIARAHRETILLREYRTRLITDVVTGKVDVRAAATKLPEEPEELEPLDDAEALVESEQVVNESDLEAETVGEHG